MWTISLPAVELTYAGCPSRGIGAIDWRRARGLEARPDDFAGAFDIDDFEDEPLCRAISARLDQEADAMGRRGCSVAVSIRQAELLLSLPTHPTEKRPITPEMLTPEMREALLVVLSVVV